eukprot:363696-Chlamydomonas_euryale.AAC.13
MGISKYEQKQGVFAALQGYPPAHWPLQLGCGNQSKRSPSSPDPAPKLSPCQSDPAPKLPPPPSPPSPRRSLSLSQSRPAPGAPLPGAT